MVQSQSIISYEIQYFLCLFTDAQYYIVCCIVEAPIVDSPKYGHSTIINLSTKNMTYSPGIIPFIFEPPKEETSPYKEQLKLNLFCSQVFFIWRLHYSMYYIHNNYRMTQKQYSRIENWAYVMTLKTHFWYILEL